MRYLHISSERLARLLYPQTLIFLGILVVALVGLSVLVRSRLTLETDLRITRDLQLLDKPWLTKIAKWLTFMGNSLTLCLLAIGVAAISLFTDQSRAAFFVGASLLALPLNVLIKNVFDRERPGELEVRVLPGPRWGFSYPSGHSMGSAAFYGFLAFLVWLHMTALGPRVGLFTLFSLLPVGVGASRIYLGAHWFSDVVGGITAGTVLVAVLAVLYPV